MKGTSKRMNPLRLQACVLIVLSVPFAVLGFRHSDWAAWATAFVSVIAGAAVACLANKLDKQT